MCNNRLRQNAEKMVIGKTDVTVHSSQGQFIQLPLRGETFVHFEIHG